jgi:hypothetical protein
MCTELILAFIYFITIFFVNYFLFKLLKSNLANIFYFLKNKNILKNFNVEQKKNIFYYLICLMRKMFSTKLIQFLNQQLKTDDFLVIGSTYKFLLDNIDLDIQNQTLLKQSEQKKLFFSNKLYLNLLKDQYLVND